MKIPGGPVKIDSKKTNWDKRVAAKKAHIASTRKTVEILMERRRAKRREDGGTVDAATLKDADESHAGSTPAPRTSTNETET